MRGHTTMNLSWGLRPNIGVGSWQYPYLYGHVMTRQGRSVTYRVPMQVAQNTP